MIAMSRAVEIDSESLPYRPCVGIMVLNEKGLVWCGKRIAEPDSEFTGSDRLWQMPQGGIDDGEDPLAAARRELYEETGITSIEVVAEAGRWIKYDLPAHLVGIAFKGKYRGQIQRWFAFRFTGEDSEIAIDPPPGGHTPEFESWGWKEMAELPELIVPFKRAVYEQVVDEFKSLAGAGST